MPQYDNSNSGVLFKNEEKREGKKDPDYRGQADIGGVLYWLDAWINEAKKDGRKFLSIRFKEKEGQKATPNSRPQPIPQKVDPDDEIPFD